MTAGIAFMNKSWDKDKGGRSQWIAWMTEVATECLRLLKPGGHALVWALPRTSHWTATAWEDAGFEVRDCVYHIFSQGFPKSLDIAKQIDKAAGRIGASVIEIKREIRRRYKQRGMTLSEFNAACGFEASGYLRESSTWAGVLPSRDKWERIKSVIGCNGELDALFAEAEREVIGQAPWQNSANHFVPGADHTQRVQLDITAPATDEAKQFAGWGTALKPAVECWFLLRKPLSEPTVAANVLRWGVGGLNIDGCRIPASAADAKAMERCNTPGSGRFYGSAFAGDKYGNPGIAEGKPLDTTQGRWPANLILSDDAAALLDEQVMRENARCARGDSAGIGAYASKGQVYGNGNGLVSQPKDKMPVGYGNGTPGASRFFLRVAHDADDVPSRMAYVPKASRADRNSHGAVNNTHPTCKPSTLMKYLCKLICPPNGTILDPFLGSGSTGVAAVLEGFNFVGIDNEAEYLEIARPRIAHAAAAQAETHPQLPLLEAFD